jgi:hypothetical protein
MTKKRVMPPLTNIPRIDQDPVQQPTYGTDWRALIAWAQQLYVTVTTAGGFKIAQYLVSGSVELHTKSTTYAYFKWLSHTARLLSNTTPPWDPVSFSITGGTDQYLSHSSATGPILWWSVFTAILQVHPVNTNDTLGITMRVNNSGFTIATPLAIPGAFLTSYPHLGGSVPFAGFSKSGVDGSWSVQVTLWANHANLTFTHSTAAVYTNNVVLCLAPK